jgi:hypothetical protein
MPQRHSSIPPRADLDFLVESIPNPVHGNLYRREKRWMLPVVALILSFFAAAICEASVGDTLGLYLGGIFAAALLVGPLISAEETWRPRLLIPVAIWIGIGAVWFNAWLHNHIAFMPMARSNLALLSFCFALAGIGSLLRRIGLGFSGSATAVTLLALAWLLWPIWLSPVLSGAHGETIVNLFTPIHPIMAINAAVREPLGYWAEQSIAYNYTNISDDITYSLPTSVFPCVAFHVVLAGACFGVVWLLDRFTGRSMTAA